jgi:hypothetical protein
VIRQDGIKMHIKREWASSLTLFIDVKCDIQTALYYNVTIRFMVKRELLFF